MVDPFTTVSPPANVPVLPPKLESPLYTAVIVCIPTDNELVVKVACAEPLRVPVPRVVAPSLNVTVPVGVPTAGATGLTVAVKVTDCPGDAGLTDVATAVVVNPVTLVRANVAFVIAGPGLAVTLYVPVVVFAVKVGAVATPFTSVVTEAVADAPNNPLAPAPGAVNVTLRPP